MMITREGNITENKKVFLIPCCDYSDINPVDSGYHSCPPDFKYGPGARNYTILHYVISGKGILRKNGSEYEVNSGQCFIIRNGETAYYKSDSLHPWSYIWLGFRTELDLPGTMRTHDVIDGAGLESVFLPILKQNNTEPELSVFLCSKCWELFALFERENSGEDNSDILQRAKIFIENEYMNDISVTEIAAMLYTDRSVFSKSFKRRFGVSPQEYLCSFRLSKALEFIRSGEYTLTGIARMCGYKDYCNFSRMFTRKYGISPGKMR